MATRVSQAHFDPVDHNVDDTGDATAVASLPGDGAKGFFFSATFPHNSQVSTVADNAVDFPESQHFGKEFDGSPFNGAGAGLAGTAQDSTAASSTAVESDMGSSAVGGSLGTVAHDGVVAKRLTTEERRKLVSATMPLRDMEEIDGLDLYCPLEPLSVLSDFDDSNVMYCSSFLALRSWLREVSSAEHLISIRVAARRTEYEVSVLQRLSEEFVVVYDREDEEYVISLPWGLSRRARNRLMHALIGNGSRAPKGAPSIKCTSCGSIVVGASRRGVCQSCTNAARAVADMGVASPPAASAHPIPGGAPAGGGAASPVPTAGPVGPVRAPNAAPPPKPAKLATLWNTIWLLYQQLCTADDVDYDVRSPGRQDRRDALAGTRTVVLGSGRICDVTDYVITFNHAAYAEEYEEYSYIRVNNFSEALVNGHLVPMNDWIYTVAHMGLVVDRLLVATKVRSLYAEEGGRRISVDVWKIDVSQTGIMPAVNPRFDSFRARDSRGVMHVYRSFAGANHVAIRCDTDPVQLIDTCLFREVSRYYATSDPSRVAEMSIRGPLKNNAALDDNAMIALTRYFCAKHQNNVVVNNAVIGGRSVIWRESQDALLAQHRTKPWFIPSLLWCLVNPYADTVCTMLERLFHIVLFFLFFTFVHYLVMASGHVYGGIPTVAEFVMNATINTAQSFISRVKEIPVPKIDVHDRLLDHFLCGTLFDYVRWTVLGDPVLGWRLTAMGKMCSAKSAMLQWIFSWDAMALYVAFGAPIIEECLKRTFLLGFLGIRPAQMRIPSSWQIWAISDGPYATGATSFWQDVQFWVVRKSKSAVRGIADWRDRHHDAGTVFMVAILLCEWYENGYSIFYLPTAYMHLWCFNRVWWKAIIGHSLWNLSALAFAGSRVKAQLAARGVGMAAGALGLHWLVLYVTTMKHFFGGKSSSRGYTTVSAMGIDSEFVDLKEDPEFEKHFPLKDSAKMNNKPRLGQRSRNALVVLLQPFVLCASFASNQANILHSLAGRVLKRTPECLRDTRGLQSKLAKVTNKMGPVSPVDEEDWLRKFPPPKRARYRTAIARMAIFGFAVFADVLCGATNPWYLRSCFLKHEVNLKQEDKIVLTSSRRYRIACADPRTIQASADEIQAAVGPFFVAAGNRAAEVFNGAEDSKIEGWRVCMAFGRTKDEVARICQQIEDSGDNGVVDCGDDGYIIWDRKTYAIDASRWDAHVRAELLGLKKAHLKGLGLHDYLANMLERMIDRKGTYKGMRVRFEVNGDVASGDPDTLYWNTVCGVAIILDCASRAKDFKQFCENSLEYGIKYELAAESGRCCYSAKLDFCSCVFVPARIGYTFGPKLGRSLMKLSHSANSQLRPEILLASKIQGLTNDLAAYPEVVCILRSILHELPACGPVSESYFPVGKCEPGTREQRDAFFAERYGVAYSDVLRELEIWVNRHADKGESGDLVTLRRLVEVDYDKTAMIPRLPDVEPARISWWPRLSHCVCFLIVVAMIWYIFSGAGVSSVCTDLGGWVGTVKSVGLHFSGASPLSLMPNNKTQSKQRKGGAQRNRKRKGNTALVNQSSIRGQGDYVVNKLVQRLGKLIPKGSFEKAGAAAGRGLATITGFGDYTFNEIVHSGNMGTMARRGVASQIVKSCEYIEDLTASTAAFTLRKYDLNPTSAKTFPWLSRMAGLFTKYRFRQLLFEFRSSSTEYASGTTMGTVIMAPLYNVDQDDFVSKQQMELATHSHSAKPSLSQMCGFECDMKDANVKWYNIRSDFVEPTNFTDPGHWYIATSGVNTAVTNGGLGEIWVHYEVELIEPVLSASSIPEINTRAVNVVCASQTAGAATNGAFGLANTSNSSIAFSPLYPGPNELLTLTRTTGAPTGNAWDVWFNTLTPSRLWFNEPGSYLITYALNLSTGFSMGAGQLWGTTALSDGTTATFTAAVGPNAAARDAFAGMFKLNTTAQGAWAEFGLLPNFGAVGNVVIDSVLEYRLTIIKTD